MQRDGNRDAPVASFERTTPSDRPEREIDHVNEERFGRKRAKGSGANIIPRCQNPQTSPTSRSQPPGHVAARAADRQSQRHPNSSPNENITSAAKCRALPADRTSAPDGLPRALINVARSCIRHGDKSAITIQSGFVCHLPKTPRSWRGARRSPAQRRSAPSAEARQPVLHRVPARDSLPRRMPTGSRAPR